MQKINNVFIDCIAATVPQQCLTLQEYVPNLVTENKASRIAMVTGISSLRIAPDEIAFSDLAYEAARRVLSENQNGEIGAIVVVTQTARYAVPATSHILQDRLGLPSEILCLDINESCSGYITGLYAAALLASKMRKPILLCAGDTMSKLLSPDDRATRCVFGDAATATLITPPPPRTKRRYSASLPFQ